MPITTNVNRAIPNSLATLVAPVSSRAFLDTYWEKQPLAVHRGQAGYFSGLLSQDAIDHVLTTYDLEHPEVSLVSSARTIPSAEYTRGRGLDLPRLFQLHMDGATIILSHLHARLAPLAALCRGVEAELSAPCQANVYFTPANAQGFKPHYDTHDVFVLQVDHSKRWRIYGNPVTLPFSGQDFDPEIHDAGPVRQEFDLQAGDTLYIPRGFVHDAETLGESSLHITFGVLAYTWTDLLIEALGAIALDDPAFRAALPVGFARPGFDMAAAHRHVRELLARVVERADAGAAFDAFAGEFARTRTPALRGQLEELARLSGLTAASVLRPRPDLVFRMDETDTALVVSCYGNEIAIPKHAADAARHALTHERFRVGDLPGSLDTDGKLVLVRRLIREGLLQSTGA